MRIIGRQGREVALAALLIVTGADCHARELQAESGRTLFIMHCAVCHGPEGTGYTAPAIVGPDAALQSYVNAQSLLSYISTTMPQERPGSLGDGIYRGILLFLLQQNGIVPSDWDPESADLTRILLER
jgi:mono/diheme cytochrome c family protein